MVIQDTHPENETGPIQLPDQLRAHAEEIHRKSRVQPHQDVPLAPTDVQTMLHELRVHQIELEMQNEELRRIQSELDKTREHYFDLYDLAPVGYCSISKSGLISQINLTAAIQFGVPREELLGLPLSKFIFRDDRDTFYLLNKHLFEYGDSQKCELRMLKKDGTQFWAALTASTVIDSGVVSELRIIIFDVTEQRHMQNELQTSYVNLKTAKKHLEDANAKMHLYQQQLVGLVAHQQNIKEAERIRIAREIHDELGRALTGVKANLSVAMHEDAVNGRVTNPRMVEACSLLDGAVNTVRRVVAELRPSVLDQLGVWTALEWYVEQVEQRTGIECQMTIDDELQDLQVDAERSTALFRILQESLTNVTKHASASLVEVRVKRENDVLHMEIEDNGKGIDQTRLPNHESWGIAGMIERVKRFDGDLTIVDTSHGTLVTVKLPLDQSND